MSETAGNSRLSLMQAAFVVARRDFRAILFSKAFLFFLLGPVFFGVVSLGAASVGQRTAENREPPLIAVVPVPSTVRFARAFVAPTAPLNVVSPPAVTVRP